MANFPLTERLLAEAGGWQVVKHARALVETGRVSAPVYKPPLLHGLVREGNREYRAGLRIDSPTHIENLCDCRQARETGTICAHSIAVGLALIRPAQPNPGPPASARAPSNPTDGPALNIAIDEAAEARIHVVLPPNFGVAWAKGAITVGFEITLGGTLKLLRKNVLVSLTSLRRDDYSIVEYWHTRLGAAAGLVTLGPGDLTALLSLLVGFPRVTLARKQPLVVTRDPGKPRLAVESTPDGGQIVSLPKPAGIEYFPGANGGWSFSSKEYTVIEHCLGLPLQYTVLFSNSPVRIPAAGAAAFLAQEVPVLQTWFALERQGTDGTAPVPMRVEPSTPRIVFEFEGSLNHLEGTLQGIYPSGRVVTIGLTDRREMFTFPSAGDPRRLSSRHVALEDKALERLRGQGFRGPDARGAYTLAGQEGILRFFALGLPDMQRDWEVRVGDRFQRITDQQVDVVQPRFEVQSSGENWFDLGVSLVASGSGEKFAPAEMSRLLQMGRGHTRLANGRIAVLPAQTIEHLQQVLLDCETSQPQPGIYRVSKHHTAYLDATLQDLGIQSRSWEELRRGERRLAPPEPAELPAGLAARLRPYQRDGVNWLDFLARNGLGGILADEMGLGKTLQALAFLTALRQRTGKGGSTSLVVCPTSLIENWRREAAEFTPELLVGILSGPDRFSRWAGTSGFDLVLTSYALLRRDAEYHRSQSYAVAILDEAHFIKNPDSQTARAAFAVKASHRLVLTGTPMENSVRDVWSVMQFAMPGYLGKREDFRERYELPISRGGDPEAQARLARRLRPVLLRRRKAEVARELPEKIEQVAYCELTSAQAAAYREILDLGRRTIEETGDERAGRMLILSTLLRLRQACCDLRLLGVDVTAGESEADDEDASGEGLSPLAGSAKLALLLELLEQAREGTHRVLIFSQFVSMLKLIGTQLEQHRVSYAYLDGSTKDRQAEVDRFQLDSGPPVFLISLKAGGTGLNLTAADTVIHFDPWWNPAVQAQATDRAHRIGQNRVVTSYQLITRDTVEEKILNLQRRKREATEAVIERDGFGGGLGGLTMAEMTELLS